MSGMILFVLIAVAVVGMLFGVVKSKQGFGWGRLLAVIGAIATVVLAIVSTQARMNPSRFRQKENAALQERELRYQHIAAEMLGRYLAKKFPNSKAVVVKPLENWSPTTDFDNRLAGLKAGFGPTIEVLAVVGPKMPEEVRQHMEEMQSNPTASLPGNLPAEVAMMYFGMNSADAGQFNKLFALLPAGANLVVFCTEFPFDLGKLSLWQNKKMNVAAFGSAVRPVMPQVRLAIQQGLIDAMVLSRPTYDRKETKAPTELETAFAQRFILVTPESVNKVASRHPQLFSAMPK